MKIAKNLKKDMDDKEADEIISTFEQSMKHIPKFMNGEYDEQYNMMMLQASLDMVNSLIPISEIAMKRFKNERASYAISTLLNQQRELSADIRSLQSFQDRSNKIKEIMGRHAQDMLQNLFDSATNLKDGLIQKLGIENDPIKQELLKTGLQDYLRNHGKYVVESVKDQEAEIDGFITKTPTIPKARKLLK